MTLLHVRVHWSDEPQAGSPPLQPPPGWTAGYPGPVPRQPFVVGAAGTPVPDPPWPSTPPGPLGAKYARAAWFPVVAASDLASSGWSAGPAWAGRAPGPWESASGDPAGHLRHRVLHDGDRFPGEPVPGLAPGDPSSDFVVTATSPGGAWSGSVATASGWSAWVNVPATVTDGKGIWALSIDRAAGSSVSQPALLPDPAGGPRNSVDEPYVSPYGNEYEGVLGVEVDGVELTSVVVTASTSVSIGDCDAAGRRPTTLTVDFTPPVPVGWATR